MSFVIRGLGTAVPAMAVTQAEAVRVAKVLGGPALADAAWLPALYARSGVSHRHQVLGRRLIEDVLAGTRTSQSPFLPGSTGGPTTHERMTLYAKEAPPLALRASAAALQEARIEPARVSHLITVSCTGFAAPGVDAALIRGLGLPPTVQRVHVGFMGCHGAVNGLRVAAAFTAAEPNAVVLTTAVELCSLHYYYGADPDKVVANALFADGAAAVVGTADGAGWRIRATGSCLIPDSTREMAWEIGDHGFAMTLTKRIPGLIAAHLRPWLAEWLQSHGLTLEQIGSWAVHPGGPKILGAVEEGLNLPPAALTASRGVLADYGNMSSPTVLFILDRLRRSDVPRPVVVLGFGPGLVAEAAIVG